MGLVEWTYKLLFPEDGYKWFKKKPPKPRKGWTQYGAIMTFDDKDVFIPKGANAVWKVNEKGDYDGERYKKS